MAKNDRGKAYYIVQMTVSELRRHGVEVEPRPKPGDPSHAEITSLTYDNRKSDRSKEIMVALANELCTVVGRFPTE